MVIRPSVKNAFFYAVVMSLWICSSVFGRSFGVPENGFVKTFEDSSLAGFSGTAFAITGNSINGNKSVMCRSAASTHTAGAYLNSIYLGVETGWSRISQGTVSAIVISDSVKAKPGVGFISDSGNAVFAYLDFELKTLSLMKRRNNGTDSPMVTKVIYLETGTPYKVELCWSPFANTLLTTVYTRNMDAWDYGTSVRAVVLAQDARHPGLVCGSGQARYDDFTFDPNLDNWNYDWEFYNSIILDPEKITTLPGNTNYANAVHWKWKKDNKFYMHMRNGITYSSSDCINWTKKGTSPINYPSDPCCLMDPFNDGCVHVSSRDFPWIRNNGLDGFVRWDTIRTTGNNTHGLRALQDIIDVRQHPALMDSIPYNGRNYRFIGLGEYTFAPFSTVLLSNNLTSWVRPDTVFPIPVRIDGYNWQELGDAIGCGYLMADGNILILSCTCTGSGYTGGGFEATNVAAVLDGKQPWVTKKISRLPMTPALATGWTKGPNMPNSFVYDDAKDILYFFSDFGDDQQGLLRVRGFSKQDLPAWKTIRIQTEMNTNMSGINFEPCSDSGLGLDASTHTGNWMSFKNINFRDGVSALRLRIASNNASGIIEFHLDSAGGTLAGSYTVAATGGWQSWSTVSVPVNMVSGMHDLFIVFRRSDALAVANVNWIEIPAGTTAVDGENIPGGRFGVSAALKCTVRGGRVIVTLPSSAAKAAFTAELLTMQGRSLRTVRGGSGGRISIPTENISRGWYLVSVRGEGQTIQKQIVLF